MPARPPLRRRTVLPLLTLFFLASFATLTFAQNPSQVGQWSDVLDWGVQAKHMILLPTGNVLVWSTGDDARVWDITTDDSFTPTPFPGGDLHCAGQATLGNGRIVVIGGQGASTHIGIQVTALFDAFTNTWVEAQPMNYARWYATATVLSDGRLLATSGDDGSASRVRLPEIYDPVTDTWDVLEDADRRQSLYPFVFQLPDGRVYEAGPKEQTYFLDIEGEGEWSDGPRNSFGSSGYAESAVMYRPGKILRAGGSDPAWRKAAVIDMNESDPEWRDIADMGFARRRHDLTIMADGRIFSVGGTERADNESQAILTPEIWDPELETWTPVAPMQEARMYHSSTVLLPDGRIVCGGGEVSGRLHAEVYSPPYMFQGPRPEISSAPTIVGYGTTFVVGTPDASTIESVALLRAAGGTHTFDQNQRYVPLDFVAQGANQLLVDAPVNADMAQPGDFMLVIKNSSEIPSVAHWVRVDELSSLTPGTITGRVTDSSTGQGVAAATVVYPSGTTTTDSNGDYVLTNVLPGQHILTFSATNYAPQSLSVDVFPGSTTIADASLNLPGTMQGQITALATGLPIVGANIGWEGGSALSDSGGRFLATDVPSGVQTITVTAVGWESSHRQVNVVPNGTVFVDFRLEAGHTVIEGEVLDAVTGIPIQGATVSTAFQTLQTNVIGFYLMDGIPQGTHVVTASAPGYESAVASVQVVTGFETTQDFDLIPLPTYEFQFGASHDAQVKSSSANSNYGSRTTIRARKGSASSPVDYDSYLKFDVTDLNGPVEQAILRLYVTDDSNDGGSVYSVSNQYGNSSDAWDEDDLTWNNAPGIAGAPIAASGPVEEDEWVEWDVTAGVSGEGTFSFGLRNSTTNSVLYSSREGSNPPELRVEVMEPPTIDTVSPLLGIVGSAVTITGSGFDHTTHVRFNGVAATFVLVSDSTITCNVPPGASTGLVTVTNPAGTHESDSDYVVIPVPTILSLDPDASPVGVDITVRGAGFTWADEVSFGGTTAPFVVVADSILTATVPSGASTGPLTVTSVAGTGSSDSSFVVIVPPSITTFSPSLATRSATVTIVGTGLTGVSEVLFGAHSATFQIISDAAITATVPDSATTATIQVTNAAGTAQTASPLQVVLPPVFDSFTPSEAPVGSEVTLTGESFTGVNVVTFGSVAAEFVLLSDSLLTATVPDSATTATIHIANDAGTAQSSTPFVVILPPVLDSFTPGRGAVGTSVSLAGRGFHGTSSVTFNGAQAAFEVLADSSIVASVPDSATTGKIEISNPAGSIESEDVFTVVLPPTIASFEPALALPGADVTILGHELTWIDTVTFGGLLANFVVTSDTSVTAVVPDSATTAPLTVSNEAGAATSSEPFVVIVPPTIASVAPGAARSGDVVTIHGTGFPGVHSVTFSGVSAAFTVLTDSTVSATVPDSVSAGPVVVTNDAGSAQSPQDFAIVVPPVLQSFDPLTGPRGTSVALMGTGFLGTTEVTLGGVATSFTVDSDSLVTVTVPDSALTGLLRVVNLAGESSSAQDFVVILPPVLDAFDPAIGLPGSVVSIAGQRLASVTTVAFGEFAATFVVVADSILSATVPDSAVTAPISVTNPGGSATSGESFGVIVAPTITTLSPGSGAPGDSVEVLGTGFTGVSSVEFGGVSATFVVQSDSRIEATVPEGAETGNLSVTNAAGSAASASAFVVVPRVRVVQVTEDAYVRQERATKNYGAIDHLRVRSQASNGYVSLLKFVVTDAASVDEATLRLFCTNGSPDGGELVVVDNGWAESSVTWNSAPDFSGVATTSLGSVSSDEWVEIDVSSVVTTEGTYSFALRNTSTNSAYYSSKEGTVPAELVLSAGGSPPPPPPPLTLASFSPVSGSVGDEIVFAGSGFVGVDSVMFHGVPATVFAVVSDSVLHANVPVGATTGPVRISRGSEQVTSSSDFVVTVLPPAPPTITAFSPASGPVGTEVSIEGDDLESTTRVLFGAVEAALVVVLSDELVRATVPPGAISGAITVETTVGSTTTSTNFEVTTPSGGAITHEETQGGLGNGVSVTSGVGVTGSSDLGGGASQFYVAAISTKPFRVVEAVSGLGLTWTRADAQCGGRSQTEVEVWVAQGTSAGGAVTASWPSQASANATIAVSRYSGVDMANPLGANVSGNSNGVDGACSGGSDVSTYSFDLTTTQSGSVVYAAAALRHRTHSAGSSFEERLEIRQGSGGSAAGIAIMDRVGGAPGLISVDGTLSSRVDIAVVALEIRRAGPARQLVGAELEADRPTRGSTLGAPVAPRSFELYASQPNPVRGSGTTIQFDLPAASHVRLNVFDVTGRLVRSLERGSLGAGRHTVRWDARDETGRRVAAGIYFYRMETPTYRKTHRMTVLR